MSDRVAGKQRTTATHTAVHRGRLILRDQLVELSALQRQALCPQTFSLRRLERSRPSEGVGGTIWFIREGTSSTKWVLFRTEGE